MECMMEAISTEEKHASNQKDEEGNDGQSDKKKKMRIPGIVYMSRVPQYMSVKRVREVLGDYGELGNVFLQPDDKAPFSKKGRLFTEGWVEFADKVVAKQVALTLNNTQVGGKRSYPWYADIWNIKYLPKFQWAHLNERLAYERAVHEQRLRTEISQAKREANFHIQNFEKSRKLKDMKERKRKKGEEMLETKAYNVKQRDTEDEILLKRKKIASSQTKLSGGGTKKSVHRPDGQHAVGALSLAANKTLLHKLFGGGS